MTSEVAHGVMVDIAKGILDITNQEIEEVGNVLSEMYDLPIAIYYEECIGAMQERVRML